MSDNEHRAGEPYSDDCPFQAGDRVRYKGDDGSSALRYPPRGTEGTVIVPNIDGFRRSSHRDRPFFVWVDYGEHRQNLHLSDDLELVHRNSYLYRRPCRMSSAADMYMHTAHEHIIRQLQPIEEPWNIPGIQFCKEAPENRAWYKKELDVGYVLISVDIQYHEITCISYKKKEGTSPEEKWEEYLSTLDEKALLRECLNRPSLLGTIAQDRGAFKKRVREVVGDER